MNYDDHIFEDYDTFGYQSGQLQDFYEDYDDQIYIPRSEYSHLHYNQSAKSKMLTTNHNDSTFNSKCKSNNTDRSIIDSSYPYQQDKVLQDQLNNNEVDDVKINKFDNQSNHICQIKHSDDVKLKSSFGDTNYQSFQCKVKLKQSDKSNYSFVTNISPQPQPPKPLKKYNKNGRQKNSKRFHPSIYVRAEQLLKAKYTLNQISQSLLLSIGQVRKLKSQFNKNGTLMLIKSEQQIPRQASQKQKQYQMIKQLLKKQIDSNCSITLRHMQQTLKKHGIIRSRSTIHCYLQKMRYSRKKLQKIPLERNSQNKLTYRQNYCKMMQQIALDKQIFLDQTIFGLQTAGQYGWAPKGEQPKMFVPAARRKHITLLAAISVKGFEATKIIKGPVTSRHICQFLQHYLDHLQPNEILILDNARMHHAAIVKQKIRQLNRPVRYIPAYSPQLNPIQNIFSEIKAAYVKLKECEDMKHQDMIDLVKQAIKNMRSKQFTRYYEHYEQWLRKGAAGQLFV